MSTNPEVLKMMQELKKTLAPILNNGCELVDPEKRAMDSIVETDTALEILIEGDGLDELEQLEEEVRFHVENRDRQ